MRRLIFFLFLAAIAVACLIHFGYIKPSKSSKIGFDVTSKVASKVVGGKREPSLSEIIGPIYQAVFGQNDLRPVISASASVSNLQGALVDAGSSEAANSARRLCGIMQAAVAHAGEMEDRRARNLAVPNANMTSGDPSRKSGDFFSDVIKRDWKTRYSEFQATAAKEWARIQSLEQAGDRPQIHSSSFPTAVRK